MKYWYEHYFADFRVDGLKMFTWEHIVLTLCCLTLMAVIFFSFIKSSSKGRNRIIIACAIFLFCLEAFRIIWHIAYRGLSKYTFPAHLCTLTAWIMPFGVLFIKKQWLYNLLFLTGVAGGFVAMFVPLWVFGEWNVFHVMPIQSMLSHAMLMTIPILLMLSKKYTPRLSKYWSAVAGAFMLWAYALVVSLITGINYMLTIDSAGIPFLEKIPAPWHMFVIIPIFLIGTYFVMLPFELYFRKKDMKTAQEVLAKNELALQSVTSTSPVLEKDLTNTVTIKEKTLSNKAKPEKLNMKINNENKTTEKLSTTKSEVKKSSASKEKITASKTTEKSNSVNKTKPTTSK